MADMKTILSDMVCAIVEYPDQVVITEEMRGNELVLTLNVAPSDMGKVIGRQGKIAKALRTLVRAGSQKDGKKYNVEIKERGEKK